MGVPKKYLSSCDVIMEFVGIEFNNDLDFCDSWEVIMRAWMLMNEPGDNGENWYCDSIVVGHTVSVHIRNRETGSTIMYWYSEFDTRKRDKTDLQSNMYYGVIEYIKWLRKLEYVR